MFLKSYNLRLTEIEMKPLLVILTDISHWTRFSTKGEMPSRAKYTNKAQDVASTALEMEFSYNLGLT